MAPKNRVHESITRALLIVCDSDSLRSQFKAIDMPLEILEILIFLTVSETRPDCKPSNKVCDLAAPCRSPYEMDKHVIIEIVTSLQFESKRKYLQLSVNICESISEDGISYRLSDKNGCVFNNGEAWDR